MERSGGSESYQQILLNRNLEEALSSSDDDMLVDLTKGLVSADQKITVTYQGNPDSIPTLCTVKRDAHDPRAFEFPVGPMAIDETYDVSNIYRSVNSLRFSLKYVFFSVDNLDGLKVEIVEKSISEIAQNILSSVGSDFEQYEYYRVQEQRNRERADALVAKISFLPELDLRSPIKYVIDSYLAGALYQLTDQQPPIKLAQWMGIEGQSLTHYFFGNRFQIIDDKLLLIDDETNLAMGAVVDNSRNCAHGFSYLEVVDTSLDPSSQQDNSQLVEYLSSLNSKTVS